MAHTAPEQARREKDLKGARKELESYPEAQGLTPSVLEEVYHRSLELTKGQPFALTITFYTEFCKIAQLAVDDKMHQLECAGRLKP